jgi:hypothetical protein
MESANLSTREDTMMVSGNNVKRKQSAGELHQPVAKKQRIEDTKDGNMEKRQESEVNYPYMMLMLGLNTGMVLN